MIKALRLKNFVYSVKQLNFTNVSASIHTTSVSQAKDELDESSKTTDEVKISPFYENRNPRNLEWSGHQYKRFGWNLNYPPKDFYNQIVFKVTKTDLQTYVEHASGKRLISFSTSDPIIRQYLYSPRDLCATINLAKLLANRCIQYGITQARYLKSTSFDESTKEQAFYKTLIDCGLKLEEPEFVEKPNVTIGLDLDKKDYHHKRRNVPFPPDVNNFIRKKLKEKMKNSKPEN